MRTFLGALFVLGSTGALAELLLLEHFEENWQRLPIALLVAAIVVVVASMLRPGSTAVRATTTVMVGFVASGLIGLYQHYQVNLEFELEMNASRHGWELMLETLMGATPALAPATMIYLGLLGLGYAHLARRDLSLLGD